MAQYLNKDALITYIKSCISDIKISQKAGFIKKRDANNRIIFFKSILSFINTLEVKDPYEQCVQYDSIKAGIQAHAETYSFNIESNLFNQLTKEQQKLWRKEIEQACVNGGEVGAELARDTRYKENLEVKEVDLEKKIDIEWNKCNPVDEGMGCEFATIGIEQFYFITKYFFELGLKAQKGE